MSTIASSMKRTCAAIVLGIARNPHSQNLCWGFRPLVSFQATGQTGLDYRYYFHHSIQSTTGTLSTTRRNLSSSSSSDFQAPEPPVSKGQAIYSDIAVSANDDNQNERTLSEEALLRNTDRDAVFVVSGASRGIGLEFVKALLKRTKGTILACCRNPEAATGLKEVMATLLGDDEKHRLQMIQLDIEDQSSVERAIDEIQNKYQRVDMLLNVAGILGDGKITPGPERTIAKMDRGWMEKTFAVNVFGPVMFSKGLVPLMVQRRRKRSFSSSNKDNDGNTNQRPVAVIANLSARVGSISDNELGGWYSYRMSKSALNQATRTMAHELKRQSVWCISLHPGTTDTDLSKPFQKNVQPGRLFPVEFTVDSLCNVIESMDETNSGGLYDWAGKSIPF